MICSNNLSKAVENCAKQLQDFQIDAKPIGFEAAQGAVSDWVGNFENILADKDILIDVLNNIKFISDDSIRTKILNFIKHILKLNKADIYFTSLGEENESSARIVAPLNNYPNFSSNIFRVLDKLNKQKLKTAKIFFIDDFLNSGGQFSRIINSWHRQLSAPQIKLLRKCNLYFMFAYGMETGRKKSEETIKNFQLQAKVHILEQYSDNYGVFGTLKNIENIKNGLGIQSEADSVFKNYSCLNIKEFYDICYTAGYRLLKKNEPNWDEEKVTTRILGYGNSAKLLIGQNNIPTCTLTCLWTGGEIKLGNQIVKWKPLLPRKKKENGPEGPGVNQQISFVEKLKHNYLDFGSKNSSMEIMIFDTFAGEIDLNCNLWVDKADDYLKYFDANLYDFLKINDLSFIKRLKPEFYQKIYPHLKYCLEKEDGLVSVKITRIDVVSIGIGKPIVIFGFQFKAKEMNLKTAIDLNQQFGFKNKRSKKHYFRQNTNQKLSESKTIKFTLFQLTEAVKKCFIKKTPITFDDIKAIKNISKEERYKQMSYIRESANLFDNNQNLLNKVVKLFGDFSLASEGNLTIKDSFQIVELAKNGIITLSPKGSVFIGDPGNLNISFKHHYFFRYAMIFLIILHLNSLIKEFRFKAMFDDEESIQISDWLRKFKKFPFDMCCEKKFMNRYFDELSKLYKMKDVINEILE